MRYEELIQQKISDFIGKAIKADYVKGSRQINLDLSLTDAEFLFTANESVKKMAETGELQKLHQKCDELASKVDTAYLKAMDLLNRTELQMNQAENDIYDDLRSSHEDLSGLAMHGESLGENDCHITSDNYA